VKANQTKPVSGEVDPITMEVVRNALISIAEQMSITMLKTSYSTVIREILDYSTALFDSQGRIIAQASRIPVHLNSMSPALETILTEYFPIGSWRPGDVVMMNDPYKGGQHLPDIMTFTPVFVGNEVLGIVGALGHQLDIGGRSAGSYGGDVTEIYQEGLRIPPVKLFSAGVANDAVFEIFKANIREPLKTMGDIDAQIAALEIGKEAFFKLAGKYGHRTISACMNALIAYSERRMRARIAEIPDGTYDFEDWIDDDGIEDKPVRIKVSVIVEGSGINVDFTGTDRQTTGPVNAPIGVTKSATYYSLMTIVDPTIPSNYGCYLPINIIAPKGSVVNPNPPAPVVGRMAVGHRIVDVIMGAMSKAVPNAVTAAYYGMSNVYALGGINEEGTPWVYFDIEVGGWGARPSKDGLDCYSAGFHNLANTPVEMVEIGYPFRFTAYELIADSGGAGKFRGGLGVRREFALTCAKANLTTQGERFKFAPYGLFGGKPGRKGRFVVTKGSQTVDLASKTTNYVLGQGDSFAILTQGGGGYGSPLERDPLLVLKDVQQEKVTIEQAEKDYGVVIDRDSLSVDSERTESLRASLS
jgi:N-methylhydantoinase B